MRIGIDARFYGPFGKGLGRYVQKLIAHLEQREHPHTFTIFLRKENWDAYRPIDERFEKQLADFRWYSLEEQRAFPKLLKDAHLDLVHFPHYNVPLLYRRPYVVTIHDLILSRYPTVRASTLHPLLYRLKHAAYNVVLRSAVGRARNILTVSEYSKQEIVRSLHVPAERVKVTYEAAEPLAAGPVPAALDQRWRDAEPYVLYVGNAYPHKNLERLVRAFRTVREQAQRPVRLVLVGKMDYFYERLRRQVQEEGMADAVLFPGYVEDAELAALYAHASLYVFPSLMEGFGLPPLEAMQSNVPVASSNLSCLPEVLGDAAAYFDPLDEAAMAATLVRLLGDERERMRLRELGAKRVQDFSWDDLAEKTLAVYTESV